MGDKLTVSIICVFRHSQVRVVQFGTVACRIILHAYGCAWTDDFHASSACIILIDDFRTLAINAFHDVAVLVNGLCRCIAKWVCGDRGQPVVLNGVRTAVRRGLADSPACRIVFVGIPIYISTGEIWLGSLLHFSFRIIYTIDIDLAVIQCLSDLAQTPAETVKELYRVWSSRRL